MGDSREPSRTPNDYAASHIRRGVSEPVSLVAVPQQRHHSRAGTRETAESSDKHPTSPRAWTARTAGDCHHTLPGALQGRPWATTELEASRSGAEAQCAYSGTRTGNAIGHEGGICHVERGERQPAATTQRQEPKRWDNSDLNILSFCSFLCSLGGHLALTEEIQHRSSESSALSAKD
ncbi:unnamed protein product [Arctogadus glacialis]